MKLVIVESPAKAKTINKYLGNEFKVIASFGHIRDLPSKIGSVLPDENFLMKYDISDKAGKYVDVIIKGAKKADAVYLATDPDREGESISWHIAEVIKERNKVKSDNFFKRVAFNEITQKVIISAVENPRKLDINLVNAQEVRRALDYLVDFTLSPVLWRTLPGCKSAGRVQSVALRLICECEDEIERFKSEEYWDISLKIQNSNSQLCSAKLTHVNDQKLACSNYPECTFRKSILSGNDNNEANGKNISTIDENKVLSIEAGVEIFLKKGPYGPYVQYGQQTEDKTKPKRASLPLSLNQGDITLDMALKLLSLPLKIGNHKDSGVEIAIGYGKFGPYIKYMGKFISIPKKYDFLNLRLDDAMNLIEQKFTATPLKKPNALNLDEATKLIQESKANVKKKK